MEHKFDLLPNAIDSLREGLEQFEKAASGRVSAYKFAVLHFSHFIELLFKHYVSNAHPLLIYKNPFSKNIEKENTIGLWEAIQFLKNEGAEFTKDFSYDLEWLKKLRNDIEHHKFELETNEVRRILGRIIRATAEFIENHENFVDIAQHLGAGHKKIYDELVDEYRANLNDAKILAHEKTEESVYDCTYCGETDTCANIDGKLVCQLCHEEQRLYRCCQCEQVYGEDLMTLWNEEYDDHICDFCRDHILYKD